jgi:hypothetical protein
MRKLTWIVVILAALYGGYWVAGSRAALSGMRAALDGMKADGSGDYAAVTLHGFPSRFDITIDRPRLLSADGRIGWSAEFLQLLALSYRPNQVIAVWPQEQTITLDGRDLRVNAESLRASVTTEPTLSLALDHAEVEGLTLGVDVPPGRVIADKLILAARQAGRGLNSYDLALVATRPGPDAALRRMLDPAGALPPAAEEIRITANATFERRLDRSSLEAPPRLVALDGVDARLVWGSARFTVTGSLAADADGYAQGGLEVTAEDWEQIFALARSLGIVPAGDAARLHQILSVMAQGAPEPGTLKVPLRLEGGLIRLGGVAIGIAPRF